jgi:hypothetical protein
VPSQSRRSAQARIRAGERRSIAGARDGGGPGHRRPAAERRQLRGAHAALVPRARRAGAAGQGIRRPRDRALHLGRHLQPVPPPRLRPRAPIRRQRKHGAFYLLLPSLLPLSGLSVCPYGGFVLI